MTQNDNSKKATTKPTTRLKATTKIAKSSAKKIENKATQEEESVANTSVGNDAATSDKVKGKIKTNPSKKTKATAKTKTTPNAKISSKDKATSNAKTVKPKVASKAKTTAKPKATSASGKANTTGKSKATSGKTKTTAKPKATSASGKTKTTAKPKATSASGKTKSKMANTSKAKTKIAANKATKTKAKNKKTSTSTPMQDFIKKISTFTDHARVQKSLKMLKSSRFQLFCEFHDDHVIGVVRSQTDPSLLYSCRIDAEGSFSCCTQNLRPCGGLSGRPCKHILVLVIGLTQAGEVTIDKMQQWVQKTKSNRPYLNKDTMSETFLKYKGVEAGEVEWRPTETIPEDYYAF